jgi:hypothetical protein
MSEAEGRLYGLMEIAEHQQAAVQAALDGLAAERAALAALAQGMPKAVHAAVLASLAGAAGEGVKAVRVATQPLLGELDKVAADTGRAEAALRRVVQWASWRLLGWIMALMVALVLLGWLSSTALVWWDSGRIEKLQDQIATLQANHDAWVKAGMLDRLERCNPGNRPCVEVDENAGTFGTQGDYRVIQGY